MIHKGWCVIKQEVYMEKSKNFRRLYLIVTEILLT